MCAPVDLKAVQLYSAEDALGSVRVVTGSGGSVVANYDTDAWGNPLPSTSDSVPNGGFNYGFVGALGVRYDSDTGLYYMRQRWYDPTLQRFLARDPIPNANLYQYALDNPARFTDISGLACTSFNDCINKCRTFFGVSNVQIQTAAATVAGAVSRYVSAQLAAAAAASDALTGEAIVGSPIVGGEIVSAGTASMNTAGLVTGTVAADVAAGAAGVVAATAGGAAAGITVGCASRCLGDPSSYDFVR